MKKLSLYLSALFMVIGSISCEKEVSPDLEVTVVDNDNSPQEGKWVKTYVRGFQLGILQSDVEDSAETDAFGKVYFRYKNTRLIDIALFDGPNDSVIIDSTSVLLETKRQRGDNNVTEKKLVFR